MEFDESSKRVVGCAIEAHRIPASGLVVFFVSFVLFVVTALYLFRRLSEHVSS
jgi:hypothetical protein